MDGIDLLQQLVRIPSPNPPGDTRDIADFVAERMRAIGCAVRQPSPADKPEAVNTIAVLGTGEPRIMLHAHIDTVPIARDPKPRSGASIPTLARSATPRSTAKAASTTKRCWHR